MVQVGLAQLVLVRRYCPPVRGPRRRAGSLASPSPLPSSSSRPRSSSSRRPSQVRLLARSRRRRLAEHLVQLGEVQLLAVHEAVRVVQVGRPSAACPGAPTGASRPSTPRASVSEAHSREASRSRRGRSSRPISVANVCSAGPPEARRRRSVSRSASADGRRGLAAACTTASTQPSTSASAVSRRASAAFCSGVSSGWNMPCWSASCSCSGFCGSNWPTTSSSLAGVDLDPARVPLDRAEQVRAQPRHMREEPLVGGLAQGQVQPHLLLRDAQVLAERLDVHRQQRGLAGRAQRQADVGRADDLAGEHADGLPDLRAEHRAAHGAHHADQRAGHGLHLLGQHVAHGRADALGDRVDQLLPHRQGRLDPLRAAPRHGGARRRTAATSRRPATGRPGGRPPRPRCARRGRRWRPWCRPAVALGDRLAGDVLGHVPVHRAALVGEHLAELLEGGAQVVGVQRAEHRGERIVAPPGPPKPPAPPRNRTARPGPDHRRPAGPSSCPRRRPPAPPAEGRIRMGCHSRDSSAA